MGFNSAFKGLKILKTTGNGRLNNLNDPSRPQRIKNNKFVLMFAAFTTSVGNDVI